MQVRVVLLIAAAALVSPAHSAVPADEERRQVEMLIGSYYAAVAAEEVDEVVDLHHWENSFERDKVVALVEQAFAVADSDFERLRVRSIDLYPERGIGLARVSIDFTVRNFDGTDSFSGHQESAIVVVNGGRGWRIGKVARAADFDLAAAASQFVDKTLELEQTVPTAPDTQAAPPSSQAKVPKLAGTAAPAGSGSPPTVAHAQSSLSSGSSGGLTFFALRRKATGACEVVAGAEGIAPGDTVLGAFSDFSAAQRVIETSCTGAPAASSAAPQPVAAPPALTNERLDIPDEKIIRGRWGAVVAIAGNQDFAGSSEGGRPVTAGLFVPPGDDGPTEAVFRHDGSPTTLRGTATIIDCLGYCGGRGSVTLSILGNGRELWSSGKLHHSEAGRPFEIDLSGVTELRLVTHDGGNGNDEDWAAWLDLRVEEGGTLPTAAAARLTADPGDGPALLAIPRYRADESTAGAWVVDLSDGSVEFVDRVGIDGRTYRRRTMSLNVFTALGRPSDQLARPGEILVGDIRSPSGAVTGLFLVDSSTGAAAYLADLENQPHRARLRRVNGRPAAAIASDDGNFALVMRRDRSGETDGAYLYHATTGQCVHFAHVADMPLDPEVRFTSPLPTMEGRVVALPVQDGREATPEALLIDETTGELFRVGGLDRAPVQVAVTPQHLDLFDFFPEPPPEIADPRFVMVPGYSDNGATDVIFVIDAASGRMAALKGVRSGGALRLIGSTKSLEGYLPAAGARSRTLAAVPKVGASGTTDGAWIFDAAMDAVLVLEDVRGPHNLKIRTVDRLSN